MFKLRLSSSLSIPTPLYYEKTGFSLVTPPIDQLQLTNEYAKYIIQNSIRDDNPLLVFAEIFIPISAVI